MGRRFVSVVMLLGVLVLPAGAVSKRRQCAQRCGGMMGACARNATAFGFGDLARACKKSVLRRCTAAGPAVCDCGDGTASGNEACDGSDLQGATCESLHFASGTLTCQADCRLDTSACVLSAAPSCGDGVRNGADEECDGGDGGGATCQSQGFAGGTLACGADCRLDTAGCTSETVTLPVSLAGGGPSWWDGFGSVGFGLNDASLGLPKVRYDG